MVPFEPYNKSTFTAKILSFHFVEYRIIIQFSKVSWIESTCFGSMETLDVILVIVDSIFAISNLSPRFKVLFREQHSLFIRIRQHFIRSSNDFEDFFNHASSRDPVIDRSFIIHPLLLSILSRGVEYRLYRRFSP